MKIDWSADRSQMSECGALIQKEVGGVERPTETRQGFEREEENLKPACHLTYPRIHDHEKLSEPENTIVL